MRTLCIKCMYICKRYVCNLINNIQMVNIVDILCELVAPFLLNSTYFCKYLPSCPFIKGQVHQN